jgi:hypothetical protein
MSARSRAWGGERLALRFSRRSPQRPGRDFRHDDEPWWYRSLRESFETALIDTPQTRKRVQGTSYGQDLAPLLCG